MIALALAMAAQTSLAVPFLPQTEALCGGAAAAMVFRYWGERHADVQQFAPLVDSRKGGIETGVLANAVRARGWLATEIRGSLDAIRTHLQEGAPLILLIEDDERLAHLIVRQLQREQHSIEVAHDGDAGLDQRNSVGGGQLVVGGPFYPPGPTSLGAATSVCR